MTPRGIRNNNPYNIRSNSNFIWRGQFGKDDAGFCIFHKLPVRSNFTHDIITQYDTNLKIDCVWSTRAACLIWQHYRDYKNCSTLWDYIFQWVGEDYKQATPYCDFLVPIVHIRMNEPLRLEDHKLELCQGVISFECGENPYPENMIRRGITLSHEH